MRIVIGIDPGENGAIAAFVDGEMSVKDCDNSMNSIHAILTGMLRKYNTYQFQAFLETQQAMPKQGVVSMFNLGQRFGHWEMGLFALGVPYRLVRPKEWMRPFGLKGGDKHPHVDMAQAMYPGLELHGPRGGIKDGRADAVLIAEYGLSYAKRP